MPGSDFEINDENEEGFDYSYVASTARVALYDDLKSAPRVTKINPDRTAAFIEKLTTCVYDQAKQAGGSIAYTVIREVSENFIHARFKDIVVSILDNGNTIRFADQGPGIEEKEKAQQPGFTSATEEMTDYIRGVGSGLPIVRDYIDGHNGTITIEDNLVAGAVVTISLTKKPEPAPAQPVMHTPTAGQTFVPVQPLSDREKQVLNLIYTEGSLGVTEIANTIGSPVATVHGTLAKLEQSGLIEKGPGKKRSITEIGRLTAAQIM